MHETRSVEHGLSEQAALRRLEREGPNSLPREKPRSLTRRFLDALRAPLVLLLLAAFTFDLGAWLFEGAHGFPFESVAIGLIVVLNAALEVAQGARAERALVALQELATPTVMVWRDGRLVERPVDQLVPEDVVRLEGGTRIPADGILMAAEGIRVDTSALTGESVPEALGTGEPVAAGTTVVAGHAEMRVTATGASSAMGRLATLLGNIDRSPTPLQRRLSRFGSRVAVGALALAASLTVAGLLLGGDLVGTLLFAVALTVAAVPEGLPAVVTGALALGTQRMARRKAIVRRLAAVETLGSVTLIASDKTGTLTRNQMELIGLDTMDAEQSTQNHAPPFTEAAAKEVLRAAVLASMAEPDSDTGDPMERAVLVAAEAAGISPTELREGTSRISTRPFDAAWAYLRVTVEGPDGVRSYLKGAPEAILAKSHVTAAEHDAWHARAEVRAHEGQRTLLVATSPGESEEQLEPLGLLAFRDPPRGATPAAVEAVQKAGARVVMITGDHPATAAAIAQEIGIPTHRVARGSEIADLQASNELISVDVFARTAPEQKLDLVKAYQAAGHVVAMTGDGVNDAPALRKADVGVAMGERGTDVAREAADVVLLDDDLATLVAAVEEGRTVAANVRSFVRFLFAANLAEVLTVTLAFVITVLRSPEGSPSGFQPPLSAAQILWINLMTDSFPALALALDRRPSVMSELPHATHEPLLSRDTGRFLAIAGTGLSLVSLAPALWLPWFSLDSALQATVMFTILVLGQLALVDGARRGRSTPQPNRVLLAALLLSGGLQVAALLIPSLRLLLGLSPLPLAVVPGITVSVVVVWALGRVAARGFRRR